MIELEILQHELQRLPKAERLKLAHWLLDSLVDPAGKELPVAELAEAYMTDKAAAKENPLSEWVGIFSGGPGDTAERAEEILEAEINKIGGFGQS